MAAFYDLFKLFKYAFTPDPISRQTSTKDIQGAGIRYPNVIPDLRGADSLSAGAGSYIRVQNDLIDLTTTTNRVNRYKEYDRLIISVAEVDMAMTVFADETCVAGDTIISTLLHGPKTIEWLTQNREGERFPVYCYDFNKQDYAIGWAYDPRLVKKSKTIRIMLDNGQTETVTPDHRILKRNGEWVYAANIQEGDELMPFYRIKANQNLTKLPTKQFPRIFSFKKGWMHERQFIDEWRLGKDIPQYARVNHINRLIQGGMNFKEIPKIIGKDWRTIKYNLKGEGFTYSEVKCLAKYNADTRRVVGVQEWEEIDVYDLSVENHQNFCTNNLVMHNCQRDENGHVFKIECANKNIVDELSDLFYHRDNLNFDQMNMWNKTKRLFIKGDAFWEIVIDPDDPKAGVLKVEDLPPENMYRIETVRGKVLEFQQGKEGPDYNALLKAPVETATEEELKQSLAIRFTPDQIIHLRIGDYRKSFFPYGVSLIEPARGPAHQLRMMEDAMVVYRLCITGYVNVRTQDGWKYMKDIVVGDEVFSFTQDDKLVKTKVLAHVNNGIKDVYSVKSATTEVKATNTHPFLVRDKLQNVVLYVDTQDLKPGIHQFIHPTVDVEIPKRIERFYSEKVAYLSKEQKSEYRANNYSDKKQLIEESLVACKEKPDKKKINKIWSFLLAKENINLDYKLAKTICKKFKLNPKSLVARNKNERNAERIKLPKYVTEEFAQLCGFLIGDGTNSMCNRCNKLEFAAGEIESLNKKYQKLMEKYFGRCVFQQDKRKKKGIGNYVVNSIAACSIMKQIGIIGTSYTKRIPSWVFTERKSIRKAFISGLCDADGIKRETNRGPTWRTTLHLTNKLLIEDVKELWSGLGYHSSHIKRYDANEEKYIYGKKTTENESWSIYISESPLPHYEDIESVLHVGKEEVYDITVDHPEHNFIANGVPIHNTRSPERRIFYVDVGQLPPFKAEAFMERLKDQYRKKKVVNNLNTQQGPGAVDERWHPPSIDEDYWVPIRQNSQTRIDTLPGACISLDTKIPLLDGRILPLTDIIKEYENGKQLWAYSCNPENGSPAPGKITWAGITRKNTQVLKITFDNGENITCTPDHKFPIIGKGFVQAKDLEIGESVIAFNKRLENLQPNRPSKYWQIYDHEKKKWIFVHRMVANFVKGTKFENNFVYKEEFKDAPKNVIHHKDYDHLNNTVENLYWMNWDDHELYHRDNQEETNKNISKALKEYHANLNEEQKQIRDKTLAEKSKLGIKKLTKKLKNPSFNKKFRQKQKEGWEKAKAENPELHENRGKKISERNLKFWSNSENKKKVFDKQTIVYPDSIFEFFKTKLLEGQHAEVIAEEIKNNENLVNDLVQSNQHIQREIDITNQFSIEHLRKMLVQKGYKSIAVFRKHLGIYKQFQKTSKTGRPKTEWPKKVMDEFMSLLKQNKDIKTIIETINANEELRKELKRTGRNQFTRNLMNKMLKAFGYKNLSHARKEAPVYNHRIVSIEWLTEPMDTGTLTIDGNEELHDYHTFAVSPCYIRNSNLGEIDDTVYFRNKLFTALNFPKNYFSLEDPNATRITLSAQDIKFARLIERLQSCIEEGLYQIAHRHLHLLGYPPEEYEDLVIKMTPPSDWRELSRAEIWTNRINNANSLKSSQLISDYDILIRWMKYSEKEAEEMIARMKIQKLEDLKLQVMAQNPQLLGVGIPGQGEQEIGAQPGGPSPMLGAPEAGGMPGVEGMPPEGMPGAEGMPPEVPPTEAGKETPVETPSQAKPLPEPEEDDIIKYDLELQDYESEQDEETPDLSEAG